MAKTNSGVTLNTPQQVWDYYCTIGGFEHTQVNEEVESWIVSLFTEFSEDEFIKVIRNAPSTPAYVLFDTNFFKNTLENLRLKDEMACLKDEMEDMKSVDRKAANSIDMLTKLVAATMEDEVKKVVLNDLQEEFTGWVHSNFGPNYVAPTIYVSSSGKTINGVVNENFDYISMWVDLGVPVMLKGPAGTGKNVTCRQISEFLDRPYIVINSIKDSSELLGFKTANGTFSETPFTLFVKYCIEKNLKGIVVFDEIDNGEPDAMVTVNDCIASYELTLASGEHLKFKDNINFIACANTWGTGATSEYVGRNQLDAATLNRFAVVIVDYDHRVEESICEDLELLSFLQDFRKATAECGINHITSYRNISNAYHAVEYLKQKGKFDKESIKQVLKQSVVIELTEDSIRQIIGELNTSSIYTEVLREMAKLY